MSPQTTSRQKIRKRRIFLLHKPKLTSTVTVL